MSPAGTTQKQHALSSFLTNRALEDSLRERYEIASAVLRIELVMQIKSGINIKYAASQSESLVSSFPFGLATKKLTLCIYVCICAHAPLSYIYIKAYIYIYIYIYIYRYIYTYTHKHTHTYIRKQIPNNTVWVL